MSNFDPLTIAPASNAVDSGPFTPAPVTPAPVTPKSAERPGLRAGDRETGGQFFLEQNYPNPFCGITTVPFVLAGFADVRLDVFDMLGRKVTGVVRNGLGPGPQSIKLNLAGLGLPTGEYSYQLQVSTRHGVYRQRKIMTAE